MKKTLSKILVAVAIVALTAGTSMAQNGRFSVGAELGLPMGDFKDANGIGIGGTLRYEYPISDALAIGLGVGYITFAAKDITITIPFFGDTTVKGSSFNVIPIQAFAKYYFGGEAQDGFYGMINLGMSNGKSSGEGAEGSTKLSYAPELGYHLTNIDLGLRYQMISTEGSTTSWIGVRLAYVFGEK